MKNISELRARFQNPQQASPPLRGPVFLSRDDVPAPSLEEARVRIWSRRGFFASLDAETLSALEKFEHSEVVGPANDEGG